MISLNTRTVAGPVSGEILRGRLPLPWALVPVKVTCQVFDRFGNKPWATMVERVLVQGKLNLDALLPRLRDGVQVLVVGQGVPARVVAADQDVRGSVTLAETFQIYETKE